MDCEKKLLCFDDTGSAPLLRSLTVAVVVAVVVAVDDVILAAVEAEAVVGSTVAAKRAENVEFVVAVIAVLLMVDGQTYV